MIISAAGAAIALDQAMHSAPPQALPSISPAAWSGVWGVLTDIDDTLTRDGAIEPAALDALHRLHVAGVPVIAITGRPWGWSEPFARDWPLVAIVAENGAVGLFRQADGVATRFVQAQALREANFVRLQQVLAQIEAQVPGARRAQDSAGRLTDIAIDHSEHTQLGEAGIAAVLQHMRAARMQATVSSIHINAWFGEHNKFSGACWAVQQLWQRPLVDELDRWLYVGDSTNDELMFERFPHSVGVANLMRFAPQLRHWPRYITEGERGQGFAEVAAALLNARAAVAA